MKLIEIASRQRSRSEILGAPCVFCGYNGTQYWQKHSHKSSCPWYWIGSFGSRFDILCKIQSISELIEENSGEVP